MFDAAITERIAATKLRLLEGGLLQEVEWGTVVPVVPARAYQTHADAKPSRIFDRLTPSLRIDPRLTDRRAIPSVPTILC